MPSERAPLVARLPLFVDRHRVAAAADPALPADGGGQLDAGGLAVVIVVVGHRLVVLRQDLLEVRQLVDVLERPDRRP